MYFFSWLALLLAFIACGLFFPVLLDYWDTGLVKRFPTAILSMGIMLNAIIFFVAGLILNNVCESRREMKRLFYLQLPLIRKDHTG